MIWLKKKTQDTDAAQESQQDVSEILKCIKGEIVGSQAEEEKGAILELTELVEQQAPGHSNDDSGEVNSSLKAPNNEQGNMKFGDNYVSDDVGHFLHIIKNDDKHLMHDMSDDDKKSKGSAFPLENNTSLKEPSKDLNSTEALSAANVPDPWRKLIEATLKDWMDENLPKIVSRIVEERIETILKKI